MDSHTNYAPVANQHHSGIRARLYGFAKTPTHRIWLLGCLSVLFMTLGCRTRGSAPAAGSPSPTRATHPTGREPHPREGAPHPPPLHVYSERPTLRWCDAPHGGSVRVRLVPVEAGEANRAPAEFATDSCEQPPPTPLGSGTWSWQVFDRGDAPGVRPARDFIVHSGHRGAITPASDLDLDEDGFLDLVFLSLGPSERCGFGLIVAYGSPSGMLRVETQNVEGCLESRGPRAFLGVNPPGLVRLQPLQDGNRSRGAG